MRGQMQMVLVVPLLAVLLAVGCGKSDTTNTAVGAWNDSTPDAQPKPVSDRYRISIRFLSASVDPPDDWHQRYNQGVEIPDPYIIAFVNGEAVFVTPPDAVAIDTYNPEWNVVMTEPIIYDTRRRDEFTILVLDSDTDVVKKAFVMFSSPEHDGTWKFKLNSEESYNDDDKLGRWSGKIPKELLSSSEDEEWTLSFGRVKELKMRIEKMPE